MNKARAVFEAWQLQQVPGIDLSRNMPDESYNNPLAHSNWIAWQACGAMSAAEVAKLRAEVARWRGAVDEFHYAMKDAGWHPGRTDDNLCDIIREKGEQMRAAALPPA